MQELERFNLNVSVNRMGYLGKMSLDFIGLVIATNFATFGDETEATVATIFIGAILVVNWILQVQRLNSAGQNRWWALLYPIFGLLFALIMVFMRPVEYEDTPMLEDQETT